MADIMMMLYDDETIMKEFLESEIYEARQEALQEGFQKAEMATAREMLKDNEPMEKIMKYSRLSQSVILELQKEQNQQSI